MNLPQACFCAGWMLSLAGCSRSNNLLLGRVEAHAGSHRIVVTDCYRTSVAPPREIPGAPGEVGYRFTPCRDADVLIRGGKLWVNGQDYGPIGPRDRILVDHGAVSIAGRPARPYTNR